MILKSLMMRKTLQLDLGFTSRTRLRRPAGRGFTIIELMVVMLIISILIGIAAIAYDKTVMRARETALKQDLQTMRQAIDNYTLDKQQAPQSLDDLVDAHYLREIPVDPVTHQKDWVIHIGETVLSPEQSGSGIDDVHSNSEQIASDGRPFNAW
jgi:general secretion pathway protein G